MGSSKCGVFAVLLLAGAVCAQKLVPAKLTKTLPEIVLSDASKAIAIREFGLGDGGVKKRTGALRFDREGECVTPGGVRVACRSVGVKLTFPSGRELLLAPDGGLHLRSGEAAGAFKAGLELLLGDGCQVRISLAQSRADRVRDVWVCDGKRVLQPWRRGKAAKANGRQKRWAGLRLACCGDGGELYRPMAIGPLLILERTLVPKTRLDDTPRERLVLLTDPLRKSLARMPRQHRETDKPVRRAVAAVAAVADRGDQIFPGGAALRRAEHDRLRWLLGGGFELQLDLDRSPQPTLQLFAGRSPMPMVEWIMSTTAAAYMTNPRTDQIGKRWHGNGTRLAPVVPELQVRDHLSELPHAMKVLRRFKR